MLMFLSLYELSGNAHVAVLMWGTCVEVTCPGVVLAGVAARVACM